MELEIEEDGRDQVTLVIPDNPDPFPTWTLDGTCTFPNIKNSAPMQVQYMAG